MQLKFENDVEMYGTQTLQPFPGWPKAFENDVKMYGTQTILAGRKSQYRLRMM